MADDPTQSNPSRPSDGSRAASVRLREGEEASHAGMLMDPANESLADALRITFRLLQLGMLVLVGLFVLSGFQTIREGQAGIRLLFGKAEPGVLDSGFRFSAPYPLGELVKVQTGAEQLVENTAFWPQGREGQPASSVDDLPSRRELKPAVDGSLITADVSIAHTTWSIQYRRTDPYAFTESILPSDERSIVLAAVQRGVVQGVAVTTIDDLLKQGATGGETLAVRVRTVAQQTLDAIGSGVTIENLSLDIKTPPKHLKVRFDSVQAAASEAATVELTAETERAEILNRVAGPGAGAIIDAIRAYERALATGTDTEARDALAQVDALLEGRAIAINGETIDPQVSGEVARIIAGARRERSETSARAQAKLANFRAQRAKYEANAALTIKQVAYDALSTFLAKPFVQTITVPKGTDTLRLLLNADPDIQKDRIRERQLDDAIKAEEEREKRRREGDFTIERGTPQPGRG